MHEDGHDPMAPADPLRDWYVNTIWGRRVSDDDTLFEVMSLQVFQAGLTWRMILNKRDGFRAAFGSWNVETVAGFGPVEVEALRSDPAIIRNRLKIRFQSSLGRRPANRRPHCACGRRRYLIARRPLRRAPATSRTLKPQTRHMLKVSSSLVGRVPS